MFPPTEIIFETAAMLAVCLLLGTLALGCLVVGSHVAILGATEGWTAGRVATALVLAATAYLALRGSGALWPGPGVDAIIRGV